MKKQEEIVWGEDPELFGPKDWFRNTLLIAEVRKRIDAGTILDYGCGTGICLRRLLEYGYHLTGIDLSGPNIEYLKKKLRFRTNVIVKKGNVSLLGQYGQTFDAIICGETLEHIKEDERVVRNFFRVLKPNGCVYLSVPAHARLWTAVDEYAGHVRRYDKKSLSAIFVKNGFIIEDMYYWGYPLGMLWDTYVSFPILRKKMNGNIIFTHSFSLTGFFLRFSWIKKILSWIFFFDSLFFFDDRRGNGLILVAKKTT